MDSPRFIAALEDKEPLTFDFVPMPVQDFFWIDSEPPESELVNFEYETRMAYKRFIRGLWEGLGGKDTLGYREGLMAFRIGGRLARAGFDRVDPAVGCPDDLLRLRP